VAVFRKIIKDSTWVSCPGCSCEIPVQNAARLPREFSVPCPNCGERKVYGPADVQERKAEVETADAFKPVQFGRR